MDELIIEVLAGHATPSAEEEVRRWRRESPENEAYYRATRRVWQATEPAVLGARPDPVYPSVILTASEERRRAGSGAEVIPLRPPGSRRTPDRSALRWSVAAATAAAAVAAVALGIAVRAPSPGAEPPAVYAAGPLEPRTVVLDDGSFVRLAPGGTLRVRDASDERRVSLAGRAFFAVTHDEALPFVVEVGGSETRVLGTRFEVAAEAGSVRTVVVDGLVAVTNALGSVEVPGGSLARSGADAPPTREAVDDVYALLDWPGGILLFQGTPLAQVAREVSRHFGRTVEVRGDRLQALRISGSFEEESFEEVVLALCETTAARCTLTSVGASIAGGA